MACVSFRRLPDTGGVHSIIEFCVSDCPSRHLRDCCEGQKPPLRVKHRIRNYIIRR